MKKALIFCLILCIGFSTIQIKAATEDSGDGNTIVLDDGTIIRYNNNAIDGGIDLSGLEFHDNRAWFQLNNQNNKLTTLAILSVMLDVPFHSQINSVDCGLAAMQMMLGTVGYNYTQSELANYLKTTGGDELASVLTDLVSEPK